MHYDEKIGSVAKILKGSQNHKADFLISPSKVNYHETHAIKN